MKERLMIRAVRGMIDGKRREEGKTFHLISNIKFKGRYDVTKRCVEDLKDRGIDHKTR